MKFQLLALFLVLAFSSVHAEDVLGDFPALGSPAEKQDIAQILSFQKTRTTQQCAEAELESNASMEAFFGGLKGPLSHDEVSKVQKKLKWLTAKAGIEILAYKTKFNRPRPYITHPEIKPCIDLESSKAYPSGHATIARVYARVLAVIFPERSALFLKRADEIALHRVLGGVHHPSDVAAGKLLGDALADDYLSDNDFRYTLLTLRN